VTGMDWSSSRDIQRLTWSWDLDGSWSLGQTSPGQEGRDQVDDGEPMQSAADVSRDMITTARRCCGGRAPEGPAHCGGSTETLRLGIQSAGVARCTALGNDDNDTNSKMDVFLFDNISLFCEQTPASAESLRHMEGPESKATTSLLLIHLHAVRISPFFSLISLVLPGLQNHCSRHESKHASGLAETFRHHPAS
jgi:hypothetical protein